MKIAVLEPLGISDESLRGLLAKATEGHDAEVITYPDRKEDEAALIERSADADIVVVSNIKYPASVMEKNPNLKYVCVAFTGYDHVDMAYCREHGIQVSNCAGYSTVAVADLTFGLVLDVLRNISTLNSIVRQGGTKDGLVGPELEGKRFGVIGAGAIGSRVMRIAQVFGCDVVCYSRTKKEIPGVQFVGLDELLKTSDVVSLHIPQTPETTGLISAEKIALMKPTAVLINCARGPVVDSEALRCRLERRPHCRCRHRCSGNGAAVSRQPSAAEQQERGGHAACCLRFASGHGKARGYRGGKRGFVLGGQHQESRFIGGCIVLSNDARWFFADKRKRPQGR